jgi:hypothetical protein
MAYRKVVFLKSYRRSSNPASKIYLTEVKPGAVWDWLSDSDTPCDQASMNLSAQFGYSFGSE